MIPYIQLNPKSEVKLSKGIAPVPPYYYSGRIKINITLARIRMHCSELHQHLADMHIIENNLCACGKSETSEHFFFTCPLYQDARHDMQGRLSTYRLI